MNEPQVSVATAQGYLPASERPQCGNCHLRAAATFPVASNALVYCNHGKFVASCDGWCTVWLPEVRWLRVNADAAARLGMSAGMTL